MGKYLALGARTKNASAIQRSPPVDRIEYLRAVRRGIFWAFIHPQEAQTRLKQMYLRCFSSSREVGQNAGEWGGPDASIHNDQAFGIHVPCRPCGTRWGRRITAMGSASICVASSKTRSLVRLTGSKAKIAK
jgi:hypothetical protein